MINNRTPQQLYDELSYYTLEKRDKEFIHQNIVDAFAAQTADAKTKPIKITFALAGLYLHLEKGFTGREVQLAHIQMARKSKVWPSFKLPDKRGDITVAEVLAIKPGQGRDKMIGKWCRSVWDSYINIHKEVRHLVSSVLNLA